MAKFKKISMGKLSLIFLVALTQPIGAQPENQTFGTGFFFGLNGFAITAQHVVAECQHVDAFVNFEWRSTEITALPKNFSGWENYDFAIIEVSYQNNNFIKIATQPANLMDPLFAIGFPYAGGIGTGLTVSSGIKNANVFNPEIPADFQFDAAIQPGMSGGPVMNSLGQAHGIINGTLNEDYVIEKFGSIPQNFNFGTSIDLVLAFMAMNGIALNWFVETQKSEQRSIEDIMRSDIFRIRCSK